MMRYEKRLQPASTHEEPIRSHAATTDEGFPGSHHRHVEPIRHNGGDYEGAIDAARRVIRSYPEFPLVYRWLAAALGQASRTEEARQALDKAIAIGVGTFDMYVRRRVPWHRPEDYEHMLDGLRKAGWQG